MQDAEKAAVRAGLPQGLADPDSKLRTAVGLAVAAIAAWDCPDAWPDLLDNLLRAIDQRDNQHLGEPCAELCAELVRSKPWLACGRLGGVPYCGRRTLARHGRWSRCMALTGTKVRHQLVSVKSSTCSFTSMQSLPWLPSASLPCSAGRHCA